MLKNLPTLPSRGSGKWKTIDEVKNREYSYKTEVSSNGLIGLFTFEKFTDSSIDIDPIIQKIKDNRIIKLEEETLANTYSMLNEVKELKDIIIAKGIPPKHGLDAQIKTMISKKKKTVYKERKDGSIDYKTSNKFKSIAKGGVLAKYIEETSGVNGTDVYGEVIIAHRGNPKKFHAGKNVTLNQTTMELIADCDGIPAAELGTFKVESVLVIDKDVDLKIGHLNFNGDIEIKGDVLDGFNVKAEGNITILGMVGNCELTCDGNVAISGGMVGKGKAIIKCKKLDTKYLNHVTVEARGEVLVQKGIMNSKIFCLETVQTRVVIGSKIVVLKGFAAEEFGSDQNVKTELEIGTDYVALKEFDKVEKERIQIDQDLMKYSKVLIPYVDKPDNFYKLNSEMKSKVIAAYKEFKKFRKLRTTIEDKIDECQLTFRINRNLKKKIFMKKLLHEGCEISSRFASLSILDTLKGPLQLVEDRKRHTFVVGTR
ncbi:MAG: hypothetical protein COA79_05335 [Planctomycetota bacterium]|nr:MAG: hypothetical protein COA79_05335 [Planctomycetota bacterium]